MDQLGGRTALVPLPRRRRLRQHLQPQHCQALDDLLDYTGAEVNFDGDRLGQAVDRQRRQGHAHAAPIGAQRHIHTCSCSIGIMSSCFALGLGRDLVEEAIVVGNAREPHDLRQGNALVGVVPVDGGQQSDRCVHQLLIWEWLWRFPRGAAGLPQKLGLLKRW